MGAQIGVLSVNACYQQLFDAPTFRVTQKRSRPDIERLCFVTIH